MANNHLPTIFNLDNDINSQFGTSLIGDPKNVKHTPFKKVWTKDNVHFRHCLESVKTTNLESNDANVITTININEPYFIYDYMSNMILSFDIIVPLVSPFNFIYELIVKFGDTIVLKVTGDQLETIMKLKPTLYRKTVSNNC